LLILESKRSKLAWQREDDMDVGRRAGRRVSSWLSPNNYGNEGRIYWDGEQIAYRSTDGTTYFDHQDTLGSERIRTNYAGAVGASFTSLPWGDGYTATVNSSGANQDNEHFAVLEHDAESDTEHAQFRNYASAQGRWLAPDPYRGSYDLTNPQSINRYAYALNNPTSSVDPSGLEVYYNCEYDDSCAESGIGDGVGVWAGAVVANPGQPFKFPVDVFGFSLSDLEGFGPAFIIVTPRGAPSNGPQNKPTIQSRMQQAAHSYCGKSPGERVAKSVVSGAAIGAVTGAYGGFVAGELFGGEVTLGLTGIPGAYVGAHVGAAVGAANGLTKGAVMAGICYAGFMYDNN
jgi:RHS repeat-associated protein